MKLTKSIYGSEFSAKKTPFGFLNNQMRTDSLINNAGWFNIKGERLGSGDLSINDMQKISNEIDLDEAFVILTEANSGWNMPSFLNESSAGFDYVIQNCSWMIARGKIVKISENTSLGKMSEINKIEYLIMPRADFYKSFSYTPVKIVDKTTKKDELQVKFTVGNDKTTTKPPLKKVSTQVPRSPAGFAAGVLPPNNSAPVKKKLVPKSSSLKKSP